MSRILHLLAYFLLSLQASAVTLGDEQPERYLPLLEGRRVGLLSNHTGIDRDSVHVLDKMLAAGVNVTTLFSPEHGFRGTADAGAHVATGRDAATGLPVFSLYGGGKQQWPEDIDVYVVDLQDVGLRFYTYYITMLRVMNEAAQRGKPVIILDRPNPLGMTVDGPTLRKELYSGVGKLPIPVVHGMTLGELARMAVGQGWLDDGRSLDLTVIPILGYTHQTRWTLLNNPSPNLKSQHAIYLYPSTCLFEGTVMSLGRGTDHPFEVYGHPAMKTGDYRFTPRSVPGATNPPLKGQRCRGRSLIDLPDETALAGGVNLEYVIDAYRNMPRDRKFFQANFFDKLIGTTDVRRRIEAGEDAATIRATWAPEVEAFRALRKPYLLYPE